MRVHLLSLLSLLICLPISAEPVAPASSALPAGPPASEAPLATEGARPEQDPMPATRVAGIIVASTGGALTLVGLGFAIAATVGEPGSAGQTISRGRCEAETGVCVGDGSLSNTGDDYATVAGVSLVVGLTSVIVGLILVSIPAPTPDQPAATVSLQLGAGSFGVNGTF